MSKIICDYGERTKDKTIKCLLDENGSGCKYVRYCTQDSSWWCSDKYENCERRKSEMGKSYNNTYKKIQEMAQKKAENEGSEEKKPTEVIVPQPTEKLPVDEEKIIPETEEKKEPVKEKPIEEEKQDTEIEVPKTVDDGKQEEPATADEPIAETPIEEKEEDKTEVVPVPHSTLQRVIY